VVPIVNVTLSDFHEPVKFSKSLKINVKSAVYTK